MFGIEPTLILDPDRPDRPTDVTPEDGERLASWFCGLSRTVGLGKIKCHVCGRVSGTRWKHVRHYLVHTGERPHECHLCDYKGSQLVALEGHLARKHNIGEVRKKAGPPHSKDVHPRGSRRL